MIGLLLSANKGDSEEPARIVRLARVYELLINGSKNVKASCGRSSGETLLRLHDEKGSLTALWQSRTCAEAFAPYIDGAWNAEGEIATTHVCADEGEVYSGTDQTWHVWVWEQIGDLMGMDSPSPFLH